MERHTRTYWTGNLDAVGHRATHRCEVIRLGSVLENLGVRILFTSGSQLRLASASRADTCAEVAHLVQYQEHEADEPVHHAGMRDGRSHERWVNGCA